MPTSIHQEVEINADPGDIYPIFMDERVHSDFSGGTSKISTDVGGFASMHDGQIVARNLELEPDQKIVQAWRVVSWEEGLYTILRIQLTAVENGTRVTLDQTGCAEDTVEHLAAGWRTRYWEPLSERFGSGS